MNKYQKLFADLQEKFTALIYEKYDKEINKIAKIHKVSKQIILDEIARTLLQYNINNNILDLSMFDKAKLRQELFNLINETFKEEYKQESMFTKDFLYNVAMDKIYSNSYLLSIGINYSLKPVKENVLKKIINKKIDGKTYSDRIWNNKNKVAKQMKVEVDKFLNGKTTVNEINSVIGRRFDVNWTNTNRLVTDQIAIVQNEANKYWRQEHDIKKVMYCATLDMKTCSDCGQYDGKIYDIDKAPAIHRHVMCRCDLLSIVNENWKPKSRWDNESKNRINWQSFEEWKKNLNN